MYNIIYSSVYFKANFLSCLIMIDCKTSPRLAVVASLGAGRSLVIVVQLAQTCSLTLTWRTKTQQSFQLSEKLLTVVVLHGN